MNIYIYSDESGVFDKVHNDVFIFGGVLFLSKGAKETAERKYIAAEKVIRNRENKTASQEIKATTITNTNKGKLYRSLNGVHKFGLVVDQKRVLDSIFSNKKSKQRYLDYAYKISVKRKFEQLINTGEIDPLKVRRLYFFVDEHSTATDGYYELREALEQEFRYGTYNINYSKFYPPIFPNLIDVQLHFCNSATKTLVRAADIVSNKIYHSAVSHNTLKNNEHLLITRLP